MIGPLTTVPGGFTHVLMAIDKFMKWIEYKLITKLAVDRAVTFICDILHRLASPTQSSQTWGPISTRMSSGNSAKEVPLRLGM
jgi:hypothetical protein